jgi:hypothetical protein
MAKDQDQKQEKPSTKTYEGNDVQKGKMTVDEAGHKGGQRTKELIEEGKEKENEDKE